MKRSRFQHILLRGKHGSRFPQQRLPFPPFPAGLRRRRCPTTNPRRVGLPSARMRRSARKQKAGLSLPPSPLALRCLRDDDAAAAMPKLSKESKQRLQHLFKGGQFAIRWGFIPVVLYLGQS